MKPFHYTTEITNQMQAGGMMQPAMAMQPAMMGMMPQPQQQVQASMAAPVVSLAAAPPVAVAASGVPGMMGGPVSGASTPVQLHAAADWAVPQAARAKYTAQFQNTDRARTGFLAGVQARNILVQSQLPQQTLAQVW